MSESQILENIDHIQKQLNLPESRALALANAMKAGPERCSEIWDLYNDVNGLRYLGGEDRFLAFLTSLIVD